MKTILGIEIPADLGALSPDELKALASSLRDAAKAALAAEVVTPADLAAAKEARAEAKSLSDVAVEKVTEAETLAADIAAEAEALAAEDADEVVEDAEVEDDETLADEADDEVEDAEAEPVTAAARWQPTAAGVAATAPVDKPAARTAGTRALKDVSFRATSGVDGKKTGDEFASVLEMGTALTDAFRQIAGGNPTKLAVARTHAHFRPEQELSGDIGTDYAKFGGADPLNMPVEAITAAICAPAEPLYELATTSSTMRPVKASLATYKPARGNVTVYPTPKLADIDDGPDGNGRGIWTQADDANLSAVKEACARIACATPETYGIYGLYRCMTIKNMMAMTFDELVAAYLNRLGALTSRLGDSTLLDAMVGDVNTKGITVTLGNDLDGGINLWTTIANLLAVYREEERYGDQMFDAWLPRWTIPALQMGALRYRRTSGKIADRLPSQGELESMFRTLGVDVTWTLDDAATWESVQPSGADGDELPELPTTLSFVMTPKGNFRALDRGDLTIGVTNNGLYRDNASNSKNEFTLFQESFEGLLAFGATSWAPTITGLCFNGAQTADVDAVVCSGS